METKTNEQQLSPAQDHLMDVFASINYWASKGKHQAFVFLYGEDLGDCAY